MRIVWTVLAYAMILAGAGALVVWEWRLILSSLMVVAGFGVRELMVRAKAAPQNMAQVAERLATEYAFPVEQAHLAVAWGRGIVANMGGREDNPGLVWQMLDKAARQSRESGEGWEATMEILRQLLDRPG